MWDLLGDPMPLPGRSLDLVRAGLLPVRGCLSGSQGRPG